MATLAEMQEQRAELVANINTGVLRTTYMGRTTEFRSLDDMRRTLAQLDADIARASGPAKPIRVVYSPGNKGL